MGGYLYLLTPRIQHLDTQYMLAHPSSRTRCPSMAEAMAESRITIGTEVAMDILFSLWHKLIDTPYILCPLQVKVFPECRGSQVEHASPELADDVHSLLVVATLGQSLP